MEVQLHSFLTSAVFREECSASRSGYFTLGKNYFPLNRRVGGSQSRYGFFREEINLLPLPRIEPPSFGRPPSCLIATIATNRRMPANEKAQIRLYLSCHFQLLFSFVNLPDRDAR